jgi:hypothetical protein
LLLNTAVIILFVAMRVIYGKGFQCVSNLYFNLT